MPIQSLVNLIELNPNLIGYYQNAKEIWEEIRKTEEFQSVDKLAKILTFSQSLFEQDCGGKYLGGEIMAVVGIGQFYNDQVGFEVTLDEVHKVYNAFDKSNCNWKVKAKVVSISKLLSLEGVQEMNWLPFVNPNDIIDISNEKTEYSNRLEQLWNGYCPESWLKGKKVRMKLNSWDFYESEETKLQICVLSGVQAIILNFRGNGEFRSTPTFADEIENGEFLSPQNVEHPPFNNPTTIFKNSEEIEKYILEQVG